MKSLHVVSFILVVIGGLNWGLVGLGDLMGNAPGSWNVVHMILSFSPTVESLVYVLVGLSAIMLMVGHKKDCRACGTSAPMGGAGM